MLGVGRGAGVDTISCLLCSPALMAVMWQQAPQRALSTSGMCSLGKWRRSFQSIMGKMTPGSPSEVVSGSCDCIPGVVLSSGMDLSLPHEGSMHSCALL